MSYFCLKRSHGLKASVAPLYPNLPWMPSWAPVMWATSSMYPYSYFFTDIDQSLLVVTLIGLHLGNLITGKWREKRKNNWYVHGNSCCYKNSECHVYFACWVCYVLTFCMWQEREQEIREFLNQPANKISRFDFLLSLVELMLSGHAMDDAG